MNLVLASVEGRFAAGNRVDAYLQSDLPVGWRASAGVSGITSRGHANVQSDGSLTITGLAYSTRYLLSDGTNFLRVTTITDPTLDDVSQAEMTAAIAAAQAGDQPLDSDLTAIAALATTAYGRSFLELADAAAARALIDLTTGVGGVVYPILGDRADAVTSAFTGSTEYWRGAAIVLGTTDLGGNDIAINVAKWRKFRLQAMMYTSGTADPAADVLIKLKKVTGISGVSGSAPIASLSGTIASLNVPTIAKQSVGVWQESGDIDPAAFPMTDGPYIMTFTPSATPAANSRIILRYRLLGYPVIA